MRRANWRARVFRDGWSRSRRWVRVTPFAEATARGPSVASVHVCVCGRGSWLAARVA
jgi:hypothetical protein